MALWGHMRNLDSPCSACSRCPRAPRRSTSAGRRPACSAPPRSTTASGSTPTACTRPGARTPTGCTAPTTSRGRTRTATTRPTSRRDLYNALTYDFFGAHRSAHNGDYQLPTDATRYPHGTADLAEVRLAIRATSFTCASCGTRSRAADAQIATLTFGDAGPEPRLAAQRRADVGLGRRADGRGGPAASLTPPAATETPVAVSARRPRHRGARPAGAPARRRRGR